MEKLKFILLIAIFMILFNNINAKGKGYTLHKDSYGLNDYMIIISNNGSVGICKY